MYWIHYIVIYFFAISFARYKEYMIWWTLFSKFSDVLSAFTCARAIGNLWSICLGGNILNCLWSETLATEANVSGQPFPIVCCPFENILLSKTLRTFYLPLRSIIAFFFLDCFFLFCRLFSASSSDKLSLSISLPKDVVALDFWKSYVLSFFL